MQIFADLHIHSKYSIATAKNMDLEHLDLWANKKGITVLGTGDFTHPIWFKEIKKNLKPVESGLFMIKKSKSQMRFLLTSEISCVYKKNEKVRKIHNLILSPDLKTVEQISRTLDKIGNINYDGRPMLGLDAKELAKIVLNINPNNLIIPCHAWTPWFSIFGDKSGFDSITECFEEYTKYIYAIETGLSSDPEMNWRLSMLDNITLISNSDAHSPSKLGREANMLDCELSYAGITDAIKSKDLKKFKGTIEFFPEEGKYHFDGHRNCNVRLTPQETIKNNYLCPKCKKPVTVGTMHRVEKLADRKIGYKPKNAPESKHIIPLAEIIANCLGVKSQTKKVTLQYENLITNFKSEFYILLKAPIEEIAKVSSFSIAQGIKNVREGKVNIKPGFDGEFGTISVQ
ncbi:MAG: endonuclease Q family protein [Patescibacteria group bacterium]|nr:endonuclease Q family protein [Patescibacteria group bacterium]